MSYCARWLFDYGFLGDDGAVGECADDYVEAFLWSGEFCASKVVVLSGDVKRQLLCHFLSKCGSARDGKGERKDCEKFLRALSFF